jgi:hypothetical protein
VIVPFCVLASGATSRHRFPVVTYEIQGRRTDRDPGGGKARDVVRLESAPTRAAAFDIAAAMSAERLTVWVFATERRGGKRSYTLLGVVSHD